MSDRDDYRALLKVALVVVLGLVAWLALRPSGRLGMSEATDQGEPLAAGGGGSASGEGPHSRGRGGGGGGSIPGEGAGRAGRAGGRVGSTSSSLSPASQPPRPDATAASADGGERARPELRQPRAFYAESLGPAILSGGHHIEGVGVSATGAVLSGGPSALNPRRVGTVTSPPVALDFPANALSPLWAATEPEGTSLTFELSVSPDGERWGEWIAMAPDPDADIAPTYPDGRPNPNFGFTAGGLLSFGLDQVTHLRYRLTLYSEGVNTPAVTAVRIFYQDTTLGEGRLMSLPAEP